MSSVEASSPIKDSDKSHDVDKWVAPPSSAHSTGTLGKALDVLEVIAQSDCPLRFTDILAQVDQPRGTLHRQLSNLLEEGLVALNSDQSYELGLRLLTLSARTWSRHSFRSIAEPHIRYLHDVTGETVHLGVINDLEVVYLDKLESKQSVRMHSQVGNASPLYCTGVGKAMMALLSKEDCEARANRFDYKQFTPTTLATPAALLEDIAAIRETGLSYDREEHEPGIFCVAAGLNSIDAGVLAGVSVTAPAYRISDGMIEDWAQMVQQTARAIEKDIDVKLGPRAHE